MTRSLPSATRLDVTGYGYQAESLPPAGDAPRPEDDPRRWFEDPDRPFELEIGSGKGTFLIQEAPHRPEHNFLGIEWMMAFWRYAADRARRRGMQNVRMLHADAVEFIRQRVASESIHTFHLYFSDPWPKSRHHRRRVVQDATLQEFHRVIEPGGTLRIVTDHDELWAWYEEHAAHSLNVNPTNPACRPNQVKSNFERKFIQRDATCRSQREEIFIGHHPITVEIRAWRRRWRISTESVIPGIHHPIFVQIFWDFTNLIRWPATRRSRRRLMSGSPGSITNATLHHWRSSTKLY